MKYGILSTPRDDNAKNALTPPDDAGDVWTWTAICADTKLLVTYFVGARDADCAITFVDDLKERLANRVQVTSDGHRPYLVAIDTVFGADVDYAMLVKLYGADPIAEKRYSPARCIGARRQPVVGDPDPKHISTSFAERQNLTMRMHMRRFTRLTNALSKKATPARSPTRHVLQLCPYPSDAEISPAMAACVTDRLWEMSDLVDVIEAFEATRKRAA